MEGRPKRCWTTRLGLTLFSLSVLCLVTIPQGQRATSGLPMMYSVAAAMALLAVGSVLDAVQYDHWKKAAATR